MYRAHAAAAGDTEDGVAVGYVHGCRRTGADNWWGADIGWLVPCRGRLDLRDRGRSGNGTDERLKSGCDASATVICTVAEDATRSRSGRSSVTVTLSSPESCMAADQGRRPSRSNQAIARSSVGCSPRSHTPANATSKSASDSPAMANRLRNASRSKDTPVKYRKSKRPFPSEGRVLPDPVGCQMRVLGLEWGTFRALRWYRFGISYLESIE